MFRPGELTAPDAHRLNDMARVVERLSKLAVVPPLSLTTHAGVPVVSLGGETPPAWKEPARVATTTAGTLSASFYAGQTVDGVTLVEGDRVLVKDQSTASENGIYTVNPAGAPLRASDAALGGHMLGAAVAVSEGSTNADTVWLCTAIDPITLDTSSLPWVQIGASAAGGGDVWGPDGAQTGQLAMFTDPNGRFIGGTPAFVYDENRLLNGQTQTRLWLFDRPSGRVQTARNNTSPAIFVANATGSVTTGMTGYAGTPAAFTVVNLRGTDSDGTAITAYTDADGHTVAVKEDYRLNNSAVAGRLETYESGSSVVQRAFSMQLWHASYTSTGTAGITAGSGFAEGYFVARGSAITTLSGGATLGDVITKVNEIIAALQTSGLTN